MTYGQMKHVLQYRTRIDSVLTAVADLFDMQNFWLAPKHRADARRAEARHIASWMLRQSTPLSLAEIGYAMGGRDHSTVLYAIQRVEADEELKATATRLLERVVGKPQQGTEAAALEASEQMACAN